ncbi:Gx transporter family protein [Oscillospiraceae bacterium CM]|nr:Gx transporter family protein [Oscillospiraceae bacterium CM]
MKNQRRVNTSHLTLMGLLFALSITLTAVEYLLPPLPMLPPGVKLGLSNIVTMYCLFFLGRRSAFTIVFLKSAFVFLMRGFTAFLMSFSGGILSALVMLLLLLLVRQNISYLIISIAGAITHNLGQIIVASFLLGTALVFAYLPVLLISGVIMGTLTGTLLKVVMPAFNAIGNVTPDSMNRQSRSNKNI